MQWAGGGNGIGTLQSIVVNRLPDQKCIDEEIGVFGREIGFTDTSGLIGRPISLPKQFDDQPGDSGEIS